MENSQSIPKGVYLQTGRTQINSTRAPTEMVGAHSVFLAVSGIESTDDELLSPKDGSFKMENVIIPGNLDINVPVRGKVKCIVYCILNEESGHTDNTYFVNRFCGLIALFIKFSYTYY